MSAQDTDDPSQRPPSPKAYVCASLPSHRAHSSVGSAHSVSYADHRIRLLLANEKKGRLGYDAYKAKYKNNMELTFGKDEDSENKQFRKELDKERERRLSRGLNQKMHKKDKRTKSKSKSSKKRKRRSKGHRRRDKVWMHRVCAVCVSECAHDPPKSSPGRPESSCSEASFSSTSHSVCGACGCEAVILAPMMHAQQGGEEGQRRARRRRKDKKRKRRERSRSQSRSRSRSRERERARAKRKSRRKKRKKRKGTGAGDDETEHPLSKDSKKNSLSHFMRHRMNDDSSSDAQ